jgi:hypothetical protein
MQIADLSSCTWSCAVRQKSADVSEYLLLPAYFLGLLSDTEDGADIFFRNVEPGVPALKNHMSVYLLTYRAACLYTIREVNK